jgi:HSP20 family protein
MSKKDIAVRGMPRDREPFALMRRMTEELDRLFEGFPFEPFSLPALRAPLAEPPAWMPQIEVFEEGDRLVSRVDLPGLKKEDVKVEVTDGHLVISGERKSEVKEEKDRFYRSERQYGSFYRLVPLPEGVKLEDVKATFADGVLEVRVPLPAAPQPRKRTVEVEDGAAQAKVTA